MMMAWEGPSFTSPFSLHHRRCGSSIISLVDKEIDASIKSQDPVFGILAVFPYVRKCLHHPYPAVLLEVGIMLVTLGLVWLEY